MTKILGVCVFVFVAVAVCSPQEDTSRRNYLLTSCQLTVESLDDPSVDLGITGNYRDGYCCGRIDGVADVSPKVCPVEHVISGAGNPCSGQLFAGSPRELNQKATDLVESHWQRLFPVRRLVKC